MTGGSPALSLSHELNLLTGGLFLAFRLASFWGLLAILYMPKRGLKMKRNFLLGCCIDNLFNSPFSRLISDLEMDCAESLSSFWMIISTLVSSNSLSFRFFDELHDASSINKGQYHKRKCWFILQVIYVFEVGDKTPECA
jgi:hypothetical protein